METSPQKNIGIKLVWALFFVLILNYIAIKLDFYYLIWWFDMPVHLFGGIALGLLFIYFVIHFKKASFLRENFFYGLLFVLCIGLVWEFFEFNIHTFIAFGPKNTLDTLSDLFFDLAGGGLALLYCEWYLNKIKEF